MEIIACLAVVYWLFVLIGCVNYISNLLRDQKKGMKNKKIGLATVIVWVIVIFIFCEIFKLADAEPNTEVSCMENTTTCTAEAPCCLKKVKVYTEGNLSYGELERAEAIKFGLDKIDTTINYLFIAAAGIFALLGKIVIEPVTSGQHAEYLTAWVIWSITNSAILSAFSILCGTYARLSFTTIGDVKGFSIYGGLGVGLLNQAFLLAIAFLFLLATIIAIIKKKKG